MSNVLANLLMKDVKTYLEVQSAFDQCDDEIKHVVMDMIGVYDSPEANEDEKTRAAWTIVEALFPLAAADVMDTESKVRNSDRAAEIRSRMDDEERTFSVRLAAIMKSKNVTQEALAAKTGVGQPAICNMLKRACRPQKKTVARLAEALEVKPDELWPGFKG